MISFVVIVIVRTFSTIDLPLFYFFRLSLENVLRYERKQRKTNITCPFSILGEYR